MCVHFMHTWYLRSQKRASDPLELRAQKLVNYLVGAGN